MGCDAFDACPMGCYAFDACSMECDAFDTCPMGCDAFDVSPMGCDAFDVSPMGCDAFDVSPMGCDAFTRECGSNAWVMTPTPPSTATRAVWQHWLSDYAQSIHTKGSTCEVARIQTLLKLF